MPPPFSAFAPRNAPFQPAGDYRNFNPGYSEPEDADEFLQSLPSDPQAARIQGPLPEDASLAATRNNSLPSLHELRAMNGRNNADMVSTSEIPRGWENYDSGLSNASLLELLTSLFAVQADITGVSSAIVEYLAWIRKSPGKPENLAVLEVLEERVRELIQLASTRHWAAFKQFNASIDKGDAVHNQLRRIETDLVDKAIKTMYFFHEKYDIGSTLLEQRPD